MIVIAFKITLQVCQV